MEAIQTEQVLRESVQKIMSDPSDLDNIPGLELQSGRADDVRKFNDTINYVGGPSGNVDVTRANLDQSAQNLDGFDPSSAASMRDMSNSIPGNMHSLDAKISQANGAEYQSRLSEFVSTIKEQLERMSNVALELSKKPDVSQADLMHIQYEVMQMGIVLDIASKVGDKGSQALQTLFRDK